MEINLSSKSFEPSPSKVKKCPKCNKKLTIKASQCFCGFIYPSIKKLEQKNVESQEVTRIKSKIPLILGDKKIEDFRNPLHYIETPAGQFENLVNSHSHTEIKDWVNRIIDQNYKRSKSDILTKNAILHLAKQGKSTCESTNQLLVRVGEVLDKMAYFQA